jgi:CRP-like cAMP-binding protein
MGFNDLWADLPDEVRAMFTASAKTFDFKRGDTVYREGDEPRGIYFVNKGLVGLTKIGISGKEHFLRFFKKGQFFGHRSLFSQENYHATALTIEQTSLVLVPQESILWATEKYPKILLDVVNVLAKELRRAENLHVMILDNQIHVRVAQGLLYLKNLNPEHNWTRQEIANFCASTVSTVIKALADLEAEGLIRQEGRSIQILNAEGLLSMEDQI